jgi:hypothetical protein
VAAISSKTLASSPVPVLRKRPAKRRAGGRGGPELRHLREQALAQEAVRS